MSRRLTEDRPIDGILLVDKPAGATSHDVVNDARRAFRTRRIGHAGTLDPFATGLLVLLIGHATRLLPYLHGEPKVYEATITFGSETDTDDLTGTRTRLADLPDVSRVREAVISLTGTFEQVPPSYSAKQVAGRRAYDVARRGGSLELPPVRVSVHAWDIRSLTGDRLEAAITCAGGTYIRALARDLGRLSGSAAHLTALRRTRSGSFDLADATSVEQLGDGRAVLLPALAAVPHLHVVVIGADRVSRVRQGRTLPVETKDASPTAALVGTNGTLVAIAEQVDSNWQPRVVLPDA